MVKMKKGILAILIVIILISITTNVLAVGSFAPGKIKGNESSMPISIMKTIGNAVITILRYVGIVSSVIVLIVLGVKYMLGSAEEKAEYKKTMLPYIIGAALVFAASAFVTVAYDMFSNIKM